MAKETDIRSILKRYQSSWQETSPMDTELLPRGRYQFQLHVEQPVVHRDSDDRVRARILLEVVSGPEEAPVGRRTAKAYGLLDDEDNPDEMGLRILKTELGKLGIDVDELQLADVGDTLAKLDGAVVDANVVIKEVDGVDRQNIYINSLASAGGAKAAKGKAKGKGKRRF